MRAELLVVDLLLLTIPLVASFGQPHFLLERFGRAWRVAGLMSVPTCALSVLLVARGQLSFSSAHSFVDSLALPLGGGALPLGGLLLAPIVGFVALFMWVVGFAAREPSSPRQLLSRANSWLYLGAVALVAVAIEGALLERGIISRSPSSAAKLINVPLEDLAAALALAAVAVLLFEGLELRAAASKERGWLARWIEGRFGGYRHAYASVDASLPERTREPKRVAVIGGGIAGLGATTRLAERGFSVHLYERNDYLGGKVGAWKTTMPDGQEIGMTHGFHAFFGQYYNLNAWLGELGVTAHYAPVSDYMILTQDGRKYSFAGVSPTPILNLLSLARRGVYKLREVAGRHTGSKMEALMRYDEQDTYSSYDDTSYAQFADDARLPDSLRLVFNSFSRAFFADTDKMSMAELIKSFHFYYLSNDQGLLYDYLDDDYDSCLLEPIRARMREHGVEVSTGTDVDSIVCEEDGSYVVDGERFDYLVIATDVVGTRALFDASPSLRAAAPETATKAETLRPGQRYVVWRLWLDRPLEGSYPGFFVTEGIELLDSVTLVDQNEQESRSWVEARRAEGGDGSVIELHCYSLPVEFPADEALMREGLLAEFHHFFPEMQGAELIHEYFYVRQDFPSFHTGQFATRPTWNTELDTLFLAGDWVRLPFPAMLMEAAYTSGLLAANAISKRESVRQTPVWTVPTRGIMAGMPKRPF